MMASWKDRKKLEEYAVFGFIRMNQQNAPESIQLLCLQFYAIPEKWNEELKGERITIEGDICKTTIDNQVFQTAFGDNIVDCGCYKWTFKINAIGSDRWGTLVPLGIWFGIVKYSKRPVVINSCISHCKSGYGWIATDPSPTLSSNDFSRDHRYGKTIKQDDIVSMIFDFDSAKMKFIVNNIDYGDAVFNREIDKHENYVMAISFFYKSHEVQLLDFEEIKQKL
eukprot:921547_1